MQLATIFASNVLSYLSSPGSGELEGEIAAATKGECPPGANAILKKGLLSTHKRPSYA